MVCPQLSAENKLILSSVKIHLTPSELNELNSLIPLIQDWDYLVSTIIDRGIGPLLNKKTPVLSNKKLIPEAVLNKLQQSYYKTLTRSMVLYNAFRTVMEALNAHGLSVIALKGIYLSEWLYQDIGLRQFSDIDLLVKHEDGKRSLDILQSLGFSPIKTTNLSDFVVSKSDFVHYSPMYLNDISVEIHIKLHKDNEKFQLPIDELWKNSLPIKINNINVNVLGFNDLLIHLCIHLHKHFRVGQVQFTCFNDITNLLDIHVNTIDWIKLIETSKLYKCENIIFEYIVLVNKYMYAPLPDFIIQKYSHVLTIEDEVLFCQYLRGFDYIKPFSAVPGHIESLNNLSNLSDKFRYVWDIVFPPKAFMLQKYNLSDKRLVISDKQSEVGRKHNSKLQIKNYKLKFWWLWYPYRWWIGLKGVVRVMSGR